MRRTPVAPDSRRLRGVDGVALLAGRQEQEKPARVLVEAMGRRDLAFELAVLFIREYGYQSKYSGRVYTQYDAGHYFYWSMGAPLSSTSLINRKRLPGSEAIEDVGDQATEPGLFDTKEDA